VSERETPWERWSRDTRPLQHLSEDELSRAFVTYLERTVTNDRLVPIEGVLYELPRGAGRGGQKVLVTHRLLEGTYHVVAGERLVRIHAVDLAANARSPRARPGTEDETKAPPARTAADLGFERELGPVLDQDGGALPPFHPPDDEEEAT
jgi:hypothetical protein